MDLVTHVLSLLLAWFGSLGVDLCASPPIGEEVTLPVLTAPAATSSAAAASVFSYCTSSTSAFFCNPTMSWSGSPSASAGSGFILSATNVDGMRPGAIFYSLQQGNMNLIAGTTSYRCIRQVPTQSTGVMNSGGTIALCNGSLFVDWNLYIQANPSSLGLPASIGQSFFAQARYACPGYATNRSNALGFIVLP